MMPRSLLLSMVCGSRLPMKPRGLGPKRSFFGLRHATRASAYPTWRRVKQIRPGPYRLCTRNVTCPLASLAFAIGPRPFAAHDPASLLGSPLPYIKLSWPMRFKQKSDRSSELTMRRVSID